jgi:hypothetical protein
VESAPPAAQRTLRALIAHEGEYSSTGAKGGPFYTSRQQLAERINCTVRTVGNHLKALRDARLILTIPPKVPSHISGHANSHKILWPRTPKAAGKGVTLRWRPSKRRWVAAGPDTTGGSLRLGGSSSSYTRDTQPTFSWREKRPLCAPLRSRRPFRGAPGAPRSSRLVADSAPRTADGRSAPGRRSVLRGRQRHRVRWHPMQRPARGPSCRHGSGEPSFSCSIRSRRPDLLARVRRRPLCLDPWPSSSVVS